jgi:dihydrodipicolinate synthase/N-acetylneuraminate lyase
MGSQSTYNGVIVPAVTPLTASFDIDEAALHRMFDMFHAYGVHPFILGTTGEVASLSIPLRRKYIRMAGICRHPGMVAYAGISSNVLEDSIDLASYAADQGMNAVVATLPSYFQLTRSQMLKYFVAVADAVPLPLVIYNMPATTHMSIPLELLDRLSLHPNIVGVKDSERSDERMEQSLRLWKDRDDFSYLTGWAARSAAALRGGAAGIIPSTGNLLPDIYAVMYASIFSGDHLQAGKMQDLSDRFGRIYQEGMTLGESLWALKRLMHLKDICLPIVMPPLYSMDVEISERLRMAYMEEVHHLEAYRN